MKQFLPLMLVACVVTAATAYAAPGGQAKSPAQLCKAELGTLGAANFKALYAPNGSGANAMGKCVSKHARADAANHSNAAKACKAEMAMPDADFRSAHDGKSFAELYGRNANDRNAYGKCVSSKAQTATERQEAALMNRAKACKAERATDRAAFTARYGGNAAFGKCVSAKSKTP